MQEKTEVTWKVSKRLPINGVDHTRNSKLFNVRTGKTFLSSAGGNLPASFMPFVLEPTKYFYDLLTPHLADLGFKGKKLPFSYSAHGKQNLVNINIRLYAHRFVVLTLNYVELNEDDRQPNFRSIQDLRAHTQIFKLVKLILGLMESGNLPAFLSANDPKWYPLTFIEFSEDNLVSDFTAVETLTRHPNPNSAVVNKVLEKNIPLQVDSTSLLVDRQGILGRLCTTSMTPDEEAGAKKRFVSACSLFEVAIAVRLFLETRAAEHELIHSELDGVSQLVENFIGLFTSSTSGKNCWTLLVEEFSLSTHLKNFKNQIMSLTPTARSQHVDVLIICALAEEAGYALKCIENSRVIEDKQGIHYTVGVAGEGSRRRTVALYISGTGNSDAGVHTAIVTNVVNPDFTIFFGIAGGRKDAAIGDVVVAERVYNYESGKVEKSLTPRVRALEPNTASKSLIGMFLAHLASGNPLPFKVHHKPIAAGEKVVASSKSAVGKLIAGTYGDALAVEMEGFGFMTALSSLGNRGIVIRGISDLLDNKSSEENHDVALEAASKVLRELFAFMGNIQRDNGMNSPST
jgi:nucleoside phosphorylase